MDYDPSKPSEVVHIPVAGADGLEETVEYYPGTKVTTVYLPYSDEAYGETVLFISASPFQQAVFSDVYEQVKSSFRLHP